MLSTRLLIENEKSEVLDHIFYEFSYSFSGKLIFLQIVTVQLGANGSDDQHETDIREHRVYQIKKKQIKNHYDLDIKSIHIFDCVSTII